MFGWLPWTVHALTDRHPKTRQQWNRQQRFVGIPGLGRVYRDYMVNQSRNERNDYLRQLYGFGDSGNPVGMYPWLSELNDSNPGAQALGQGAGAVGIGAMMRIYGQEMKKYHPDRQYTDVSYY